MATELIMPKLTQTMDEGSVVKWLKKEGEKVEKGEPLMEIETDKATVEVEAPATGIVGKLLVQPGVKVPVGQVIGYIVAPGEPVPTGAPPAGMAAGAPAAPVAPTQPAAPTQEIAPTEEERIKISPLARRLAAEHGIDITKLVGTGPGGRIVKEDVERAIAERQRAAAAPTAAPAPAPAPPAPPVAVEVPSELVPLTAMRAAIAEQMTRSARSVPRVTEVMEVDASEMVRLREQLLPEVEKRIGVRLSHTHIIIKGVAKALEEFPRLNAQWAENAVRIMKSINIGMAVAVEDGLIVPVIHGANKRSLVEVAQVASQLAERARQRRLTQEDMTGGTFTVTNLGMYDVDAFTPIVNVPECAILGVGRIVEKPVVRDGQIVPRWLMQLSLTFDHRVTDGAQAAQFLRRVKEILESPLQLLL